MSKKYVKSYSTIQEWDGAYFPDVASKARLTSLGKDPSALAEVLAQEALRNAATQLSRIKKTKRTASLNK